MKWSWKLGRFAGIDVNVHATFALLLIWVAMSHWFASRSLAAAATGVAFILAIFLCVVLHEYGHALTARRFGVGTKNITLLPIGGVAQLERMPEKPNQELWIALAGPAVNVVIAAVLAAFLFATGQFRPMEELGVGRGAFLERLMFINLFLVAFNMLPAFPMDGGRVVRALLAKRMPYVRATQVAAGLGQGMALLFAVAGLFGNPMLLFIAFFVWIGAASETAGAQVRSATYGIPVRDAMITDFDTVSEYDRLSHVVDLVIRGHQQDFPVVDSDGRVAGMLSQSALVAALAQSGPDSLVAHAMSRDFATCEPFDLLDETLVRLQAAPMHSLAVVERGRLAGMLTVQNLSEFLLIRSAVDQAQRAREANPTVAAD